MGGVGFPEAAIGWGTWLGGVTSVYECNTTWVQKKKQQPQARVPMATGAWGMGRGATHNLFKAGHSLIAGYNTVG